MQWTATDGNIEFALQHFHDTDGIECSRSGVCAIERCAPILQTAIEEWLETAYRYWGLF